MKTLFPFILIAFLFVSSSVEGKVISLGKAIYVGKSKQFQSIQKAIDFAENGDTVFVEPGIYKERNILIQKSIVLKGMKFPVLDGEGKYEIVSIKTTNATIDGFKLQHTGRSDIKDIGAIMVFDSYHISVINNILDDTNFGIYLQNSRSCTIKNNSLSAYGKEEVQSGNGINCWRSDSLLIIGNKIQGHRDGLYFEFVTNSLIWRNISTKNVRYGIHFMFSHHDTYIGNVFEENESGVAVMYTNHITMYHNYFLNNWGAAAYGILLKDITDSDISGNY
ncbi:MAG: NosD domain-containing protein, partial [Ginsengibacter sp.]